MDYCIGVDGLTYGERLSDLIKQSGVTLKDVAEITGYAASSLSAYTSGKKTGLPRGDTLRKLAECFGVTCDYLVGAVKASEHEHYDASKEFGFTDKTAQILKCLKPIPHGKGGNTAGDSLNAIDCESGSQKYYEYVGNIFNALFDNNFASLLFDIASFIQKIEDMAKKDKSADKEDVFANAMVSNSSKSRPAGMAVVTQREFYDFEIMRFEREFGEIIRACLKDLSPSDPWAVWYGKGDGNDGEHQTN